MSRKNTKKQVEKQTEFVEDWETLKYLHQKYEKLAKKINDKYYSDEPWSQDEMDSWELYTSIVRGTKSVFSGNHYSKERRALLKRGITVE